MNDTSLTKRVFSGSSGYYGDKKSRLNLGQNEFQSPQRDQIGQFIALWATLQSLWQQSVCPKLPHSQAIYVKVSKSFIFSEIILGNFYGHLATFYWSHWF